MNEAIMPKMINLMVNGKTREVVEATNLEAYLTGFGLDLQFVAVGYNGEVIKKDSFAQVTLKNGDTLEIVRPVGGG
jgi:sulfur carrier protein